MPDPIGTTWQVATDENFTDIVYDQSGDFSLSRAFADGELPYGVHLYARARFEINSSQSTDWSNPVKFHVHDTSVDTGIIGLSFNPAATYPSTAFNWIYSTGNFCTKTFDWANHPTYSNIKMVEFDTERAPVTMTAFPLFYIKTMASGPVGTDSEGHRCWWISPTPADGFRPHPAFKRTTEKDANDKYIISDWCYIGTYIGHTETIGSDTCYGSRVNQEIYSITTHWSDITNFTPPFTARNDETAGETGYRKFDVYDLSILKLLSTLAYASPNTTTHWCSKTIDDEPTTTGEAGTRMVFRGTTSDPEVFIDDIIYCGKTLVGSIDLLYLGNSNYADLDVNESEIALYSPMDLTTALVFNSDDPSKHYIYYAKMDEVADCPVPIGDDTHDLMELMLPARPRYTNSITNGLFGTYSFSGGSNSASTYFLLLHSITQTLGNGIFKHMYTGNRDCASTTVRIAKN